MHLELVELLQCVANHEPSVLVAATDRIEARYVTEGVLGCHTCGAEYVIRGGVTWFGESSISSAPEQHARTSGHALQESALHPDAVRVGALHAEAAHAEAANNDAVNGEAAHAEAVNSEALRLAAQLGMTEGRTAYALVGYAPQTVAALRELVPARVLLINPPSVSASFSTLHASLRVAPLGIVMTSAALPLAAAKFDGIAFAHRPSVQLLEQAVRALRSGGRLTAPVSCVLPAGMREFVRDEHVWVAERESVASAPVGITRRQ